MSKIVVITGASGGLGAALAKAYARQGVKLYLTGRCETRLKAVKKECEFFGSIVAIKLLDIKNFSAVEAWIEGICKKEKIDLIIANAGISAGTGGDGEGIDQVKNIFSTNIDGVISTICPVIPYMQKNKSGQIAIISSLAGYRGLPSSPAYCASKAAVKSYGEALRGLLQKDGVKVNVVTPGYIKTAMTDANDFPMPFLMDADKAAHIIKKRLAKNQARIAFPWPLYFLAWLIATLPPGITDPILSRLPAKK